MTIFCFKREIFKGLFSFGFYLLFTLCWFFINTFLWCAFFVCVCIFVGWSLMVGFKRYSFLLSYFLLAFLRSRDIQYVVHLNIFHIFMFTLYAYIMYIKWGINLTLFNCLYLSRVVFSVMFFFFFFICFKGKVKKAWMFRNLYAKFLLSKTFVYVFFYYYCSFIYELINEKVFGLKTR